MMRRETHKFVEETRGLVHRGQRATRREEWQIGGSGVLEIWEKGWRNITRRKEARDYCCQCLGDRFRVSIDKARFGLDHGITPS